MIAVLDASPDGACADTIAMPLVPAACLSIVHVRPPPDTLDSAPSPNAAPIDSTMKPFDATAWSVVRTIDVVSPAVKFVPIALSNKIAISARLHHGTVVEHVS